MPTSQHFRANVGVIIRRHDGQVLAFARRNRPEAWQFPQGGLDVGEEPWEGALRELEEETAIRADQVRRVAEYPEWLAYEWPEVLRHDRTDGRRGQVQRWFLCAPTDTMRIDLSGSDEFEDSRYWDLEELVAAVHPMRGAVYRRLADWLATIPCE